jgi:hypothetical protein
MAKAKVKKSKKLSGAKPLVKVAPLAVQTTTMTTGEKFKYN